MCNLPDNQLRILEKETIDCKDLENLMCDYADGDLTDTLKVRLDEHCDNCQSCGEFRDSYLKTVQLAGELKTKTEQLSTDANKRLREALNKKLGLNLSLL